MAGSPEQDLRQRKLFCQSLTTWGKGDTQLRGRGGSLNHWDLTQDCGQRPLPHTSPGQPGSPVITGSQLKELQPTPYLRETQDNRGDKNKDMGRNFSLGYHIYSNHKYSRQIHTDSHKRWFIWVPLAWNIGSGYQQENAWHAKRQRSGEIKQASPGGGRTEIPSEVRMLFL